MSLDGECDVILTSLNSLLHQLFTSFDHIKHKKPYSPPLEIIKELLNQQNQLSNCLLKIQKNNDIYKTIQSLEQDLLIQNNRQKQMVKLLWDEHEELKEIISSALELKNRTKGMFLLTRYF
jgi:hypothetical protein